MNTIKRNQLYTNYMATLDTNITALAAGNNVNMVDDGDGNYTVEVGGTLVDKEWTNLDDVYLNTGKWGDLFLVGTMANILAQEGWLLLEGGAIGSDAGIHTTEQALNPHFSLTLEWSNQNVGYSNYFSYPMFSFETGDNGQDGFAVVQSRRIVEGYGISILSNGVKVYDCPTPLFNKSTFNTISISYDGDWLHCGINEEATPVCQIPLANAAIPRALKFSNFNYDKTLLPVSNIGSLGSSLHKNLLVTGI